MCRKNPQSCITVAVFVTSCYMKPCHCDNVPSNRKCVPDYERVNTENHKQSQHQGHNLNVKMVNPRADDNSSTKKEKKMLSANRLSAIDVGVIISRLALN